MTDLAEGAARRWVRDGATNSTRSTLRFADEATDAARSTSKLSGKKVHGGVESTSAPKGPTVGGGATLDKLSPSEIQRIQNAANRSQTPISAVGSRVNPNKALRPDSDYDFVIDANSKTRRSLSKSLPGAKDIREGLPSNQDIFKGAVDPNRPHVTFHPE